ncbi:MAG: AAA family ATPase [Snowella sp.]|nr:AAA family ATPase [Snowella sp.]
MKVKRLELKGFRGFDEIVLDFDTSPQRPTVFIGVNGVGKSSILDALAILLSWLTKRIVRIEIETESDLGIGNLFSLNDCKSKNIHNKNVFGRVMINYQSEKITWAISQDFWGDESSPISWSEFDHNELGESFDLITKIYNQLKENIHTNLPVIVYYPVTRSIVSIPLETQDITSAKPIDSYKNTLGEGGIDFKSFFQWFRNTEDLENEKRRDNFEYEDKKLKAIKNSIYSLIPEFSNLRVRRSPLRMTVDKKIGDKVEELTINQLSDGEKCLLAMVGDIAHRLAIANPSLDDPLQGEGIVLIDEIELHLHPQWQRKIIPRLTETFPNCQFIVTTHSPQVLSHVYSENIYILQSTPNGIIASQPESSYGRDSNQILENVMDVSAYPEEIEKELLKLFRLIDRNDLEGAKKLLKDISTTMENRLDDPQLIKAGVVIKRKEILGK